MNNKVQGSFTNLTTERLYLRKLKASDLKQLYLLRSNDSVNQFISREKPKNQEEIAAFIKDRIRDTEKGKSHYWGVTLMDKEDLIGTICLWNFSEKNRTAEIGYELQPKYFKRGIMSEAMASIIEFGFETLNLNTIEAFTHRGNLSSISLLERYHFKFEPNRIDQDFPMNIIYTLTNIRH